MPSDGSKPDEYCCLKARLKSVEKKGKQVKEKAKVRQEDDLGCVIFKKKMTSFCGPHAKADAQNTKNWLSAS